MLRKTVRNLDKYVPINERKHKRGDVREDGMIFWNYKKRAKNGECWVSKDQYKKEIDNGIRFTDHYLSNDTNKISRTAIKKSLYNNRDVILETKNKTYKKNKKIDKII